MKVFIRFGLATVVATAVATAFAGVAGANTPPNPYSTGADHVVFVQTDNPAGNQVDAYSRSDSGSLTPAGTYDTGGRGGVLNGSAVDHLASQGSLSYDPVNDLLYAVNAGSNTVSVFSVHGTHLFLRQVVSSGGVFPVSVAVHGNVVYVLNALNEGSVQGYVVAFGRLFPLPGSNRNLGLTIPTDMTQFTHTPGQVAFSPDGSQLVVTTKDSSNAIDVFHVGFLGLSPAPVVNSEPGALPFAVTFDPAGNLVVADTGTGALATYRLNGNGTVTCWTPYRVRSPRRAGWRPPEGTSTRPTPGAPPSAATKKVRSASSPCSVRPPPEAGTVDASASAGGQFLYVQTGLGTGSSTSSAPVPAAPSPLSVR